MAPSASENGTESPVKRQKTSHETAKEEGSSAPPRAESCTATTNNNNNNNINNNAHPTPHHYHPSSIVTWNCNGFSTRARHNRDQLELLVRSTGDPRAGGPDVICIQEARLKAEGPGKRRGLLKRDGKDHPDVTKALEEVFGDYRPFFSLADTKYAGTLTLIKTSCLAASGAESSSASTSTADNFAAFTFYSAIELILRRFGTTRRECGLPEVPPPDEEPPPKPASLSAPKKKQQQKQQKTLTSFFAPKPKAAAPPPKAGAKPPARARAAGGTSGESSNPHNHQGRFQFFFFPGMDLMQTYVPNNGTKEESFEKRKRWDADVKQFLGDRAKILEACSRKRIAGGGGALDASVDRKLLWCGDMNASLSYRDGTHWQKRDRNDRGDETDDDANDSNGGDDDGGAYEWFRDASVCFPPGSENARNPPHLPEHKGMPGFTIAERERFAELVRWGDFCDLWREQHPSGSGGDGGGSSRWGRPDYTWRGQLSRNPGAVARYEGKAMRLDYFLLAPSRIGASAVAAKKKGAVKSGSNGNDNDNDNDNGETGRIGTAGARKRQGSRELVADCKIRGHGTRMEGLFCGSDHCAVELKLHYTDTGTSD